jgi:hypothetical protein
MSTLAVSTTFLKTVWFRPLAKDSLPQAMKFRRLS